MPWDTPTDAPAAIRLIDTLNSPFEAGIYTQVTGPRGPYPGHLQAINPLFLLAVHQDFSSLVTSSSPAKAGEVIAIYATGLGSVSGTVQTGVPAPIDGSVQSLANPLTCTLLAKTQVNAPVLFAGLAPGLVGVYQVNVQIPAAPVDGAHGTASLSCGIPGQPSGSLFTPSLVAW